MTLPNWYELTGDEVLSYWQSDPDQGLSPVVVRGRLKQFGYNHLREGKRVSMPSIFLSQFQDFMVVVLLAAVLLSGLLGQWDDALTIFAIVIINALLGFIQEYRAERSLEALKELRAPQARCRRLGETRLIPASELVPGDIIELEAGDRVPADGRLLLVNSLECDEAPLTGESLPTGKISGPLRGRELQPGDQRNMVFAGTTVTRGKALAIVVATGMNTQIGKIAGMLEGVKDEPTPLQQRLAQLGHWLVAVCLFFCFLVVLLGIWRGEPVFNMVMAGISLAVAAIPEGLPAIVTVALALGVQRMIRRRAVVRKLPAVETLGCATVICSDKTGTLTKNEMTVQEIYVNGGTITVTGKGYELEGEFRRGKRKVGPAEEHLRRALTVAALCNNSRLSQVKGKKGLSRPASAWEVLGDPTEGALLVAAAKAGIWLEDLQREYPRLYEIPFEAERKRMTTVHSLPEGKGYLVCTKGAPDVILELATKIYEGGRVQTLTRERKEELQGVVANMAGRAMRVLAVAGRLLPDFSGREGEGALEGEQVLIGFFGMLDPPRAEVPAAIERCHRAGIRVVMVTGDHPETAAAIAREVGLLPSTGRILTGDQLDGINQQELERIVNDVAVFARVSPRHKLRIVRALKKQGHVVAMTGDGVNDAPAVKEADIGVAMGASGTDVTREASAMVIQDDNFSTIVAAVEEGRNIYDNIRKFLRYLLGCNIGEVLTMFFAALLGLPLPLLPIQILWINLVTDGLPALALGVEPPEPGIMARPPRQPKESVFSRGLTGQIMGRGFQISLCTLLAFLLAVRSGDGDLSFARTIAFTTLVMLQLVYVFECRSEAVGRVRLGGNLYLVAAVFISILLQLMVIYVPSLGKVFQTVSLGWFHWVLILVVVFLPTVVQRLFAWGVIT
ncbi:MAG: cation-translocating P-type ATPase [bacterium]|nr:cation-translocating P-type ATPase [Bacillota bacterium]